VSRTQILLVGVGGQGVLTTAQILGAAAHAEGVPCVVGQLHGMSQRGGSVQCTVILGEGAESSMLCGREADLVIAFEPIEALRALPQMGPATHVVTSRTSMIPFEIVYKNERPPDVDAMVAQLREVAGDVRAIDTRGLVGAVGETRTLNVLMLGAAVGAWPAIGADKSGRPALLPLGEGALLEAVRVRCGAKYFELNKKAFELGKTAGSGTGTGTGTGTGEKAVEAR
jgi:indolepyruvate ferredoxin oxidoreductase beta subunit